MSLKPVYSPIDPYTEIDNMIRSSKSLTHAASMANISNQVAEQANSEGLELQVVSLERQIRKLVAKNNSLRVALFKLKCENESRENDLEKYKAEKEQ